MSNTTDTNQASEDELLKKIDSIMPQCGEIDCATCTKRHKRVLDLIRTEKLKLLAEVRERVVGSRDDEEKYSDLSKYKQRKVIIEYEQRIKQLAELTKMEAEL